MARLLITILLGAITLAGATSALAHMWWLPHGVILIAAELVLAATAIAAYLLGRGLRITASYRPKSAGERTPEPTAATIGGWKPQS